MTTRVTPGLLFAVGLIASSSALTTLFVGSSWLSDASVLIAAVAASGILGRRLLPWSWALPVTQLVVVMLTLGWLFSGPKGGRSTLFLGVVPSLSTLAHWRELLISAGQTIRSSAAPVPSTPGVTFLLVVCLAAIALIGDLVAVSLEGPLAAAVALLAPFLTAVANSNGSVPLQFFLLPALAWLALIADHEQALLDRWRGRPTRRPGRHPLSADVNSRRWGSAAVVATSALVLVLAVSALTPHLPVRYLAEGLGRGIGTHGQVGFSPDLNLLADLRETRDVVVLEYQTSDPSPPPLRVSVSTTYSRGEWLPQPVVVSPSSGPQLPPAPGLAQNVVWTPQTLTVTHTNLAAPYLATPYPLVGGALTNAQWAVDPWTGIAITNQTPTGYTLQYADLNPTQSALAAADRVHPEQQTSPALAGTLGVLDHETVELLTPILARVTRGAQSQYAKALAIQNWLRSPEFSYSLELEPPPAGMSPDQANRTALKRFLTSKRGYCVQFATAMTIMARAEGIPARIVTGFLPGSRNATTWVVKTRDAHAWPELFFAGVGWLRFEPTPGARTGSLPPHAQPAGTAQPSATASSAPTSQASSPPSAAPRDRADDDPNAAAQAAPAAGGSGWSWLIWLAAAAGLALAIGLVPLAAESARRRALAAARDDAARVEVEWQFLTSQLSDLGLPAPPPSTLTEQRHHYASAALLQAESAAALDRVTRAVEQARYAPSAGLPPTLPADARLVRQASAALRGRPTRLRAWLWPCEGRAALRALLWRGRPSGRR